MNHRKKNRGELTYYCSLYYLACARSMHDVACAFRAQQGCAETISGNVLIKVSEREFTRLVQEGEVNFPCVAIRLRAR